MPLAPAARAHPGRTRRWRTTAWRSRRSPARAHGTTAPTARNFDWTATPRSPVARIERDDRVGHASSFARMQSKVWPIILLAVPSIRRAPTLARVPGDVDVGVPVHDGRAVGAVRQAHLGGGVDGAARRLAVRLDRGPVGWLLLRELHVDHEPGADEPDPDLGRRLEVGRVDDLDASRRRVRTGRPGWDR